MAGGRMLPPGFRFSPTDEELVGYFLKGMLEGIEFELIPVVDIYKFDPWELPEKSILPRTEMEWFFFCPRDKKFPNSTRTSRATKSGFWRGEGKDRQIACPSSVMGYRKTLVFYRGPRAPAGDRTEWVMYEYRLGNDVFAGPSTVQGEFLLCRVVQKSEKTRKTGESSREPKEKGIGSSSRGRDSGVKGNTSNASRHGSYSSQEYVHGLGAMPESFSQYDIPSPTDSWRPYYGNEGTLMSIVESANRVRRPPRK